MPTTNDILTAIAEHLGLNPEDLDRHANLRDELNLGPIELNDLLSTLAHKFKVSFANENLEDLDEVNDLIVLVEDNLLD